MEAHSYEWLSLIVRWIHVITGIAWIGTSFFFNWLDSHLTSPENEGKGTSLGGVPPKGAGGELWMVHSGGFYLVYKMLVTPEKMPKMLHWFKWEAYFTWISGFCLLAIVYYLGGGVYLLDPSVSDISLGWAITLGVGSMLGIWLLYDLLCLSPIGEKTVPFAIIGFIFMTGIAFLLSRYFSSRAAFVHVGAIIGTIMAFNVWRRIIPNHNQLIRATIDGTNPDPVYGEKAKQRSVHNNYLTLPVLFIMISGHYPSTFGHEFNWMVLAGIAIVGGGVRHFFNLRNKGHHNVWILPIAFAGMISLAFITKPRTFPSSGSGSSNAVQFRVVQAVVNLRCIGCHSKKNTDEIFLTAPKGVVFDTPQQIKKMSDQIKVRVATKSMPLANKTKMTQEERDLLVKWIDQGANIEVQ